MELEIISVPTDTIPMARFNWVNVGYAGCPSADPMECSHSWKRW